MRVAPAPRRRQRADTPETEALRLAVAKPEEMLPLLHPVLFLDPRHRIVLQALLEAAGDLHVATEAADPFLADHLARLAVEETTAEPDDVRRLLLREAGLRVLSELERESRTADDFAGYAAAIGWLHAEIEAVGPNAHPDRVREDELLLWLSQRVEDPHE